MKRLALHWKILLGMLLGSIFGVLMLEFEMGKELVIDWIKPFGTIFINALKLIAIPLILASLIKGVSDLKDIAKLSKMGGRTVVFYMITTVTAVTIGLGIVNVIQPGNIVSEKAQTDLVEAYADEAASKQQIAEAQKADGPLQPLVDIVPSNIFDAATNNANMLQIIFFSIFFGIGMIFIPENNAKPLKDFFDALNEVVLKMIDLIMLAAPFGVFALLATLVVDAPSPDLFRALGLYSLCVLLGLSFMVLFYIFLVRFYTGKSPGFFISGILPAQLLAFSTSSSSSPIRLRIHRILYILSR